MENLPDKWNLTMIQCKTIKQNGISDKKKNLISGVGIYNT